MAEGAADDCKPSHTVMCSLSHQTGGPRRSHAKMDDQGGRPPSLLTADGPAAGGGS